MTQLRIPGPTPIPDEVRQALGRQMINHRGVEFQAMLHDITAKLKTVYQTQNDLFVMTCSGTGGLEAAIVNSLSPGDTVLSVSIGVFGERFATIAETFGARVIPLKYEWGTAADPDQVRDAIAANPDIKAVLVTHNETSTGVTNDLAALSKVVKDAGKLLLVDAISSLGSINLPIDDWGCDVVVSGSQKGWMVPPGLAMVAVSEEGWKAHAEARMPRFYWDFGKARSYLENGQTPWTPAESTIFAMSTALRMLLKEGLPNIISRHAEIAEQTRRGIKELGLSLFADEAHASDTVTSVHTPEGIDANDIRKTMLARHEIVLGGGQQTLNGKIFRVGHLGFVTNQDIEAVMVGLRDVLPAVGFTPAG